MCGPKIYRGQARSHGLGRNGIVGAALAAINPWSRLHNRLSRASWPQRNDSVLFSEKEAESYGQHALAPSQP